MSFDKIGFLSDESLLLVDATHHKNHAWFALFEKHNLLIQKQIRFLEINKNDQKTLFRALLFMRGAASQQAAFLLLKRGLIHDSRTLIRSSVESIFYLGAMTKSDSFAKEFRKEGRFQLKKMGEGALRVIQEHKLPDSSDTAEFHENMKALEDEKATGQSIWNAAQVAGLGYLYDTFYRSLSVDSAHPTPTSIFRFVELQNNERITGFGWDPKDSDVPNTLFHACVSAQHLSAFVIDLIPDGTWVDEGLRQCKIIYDKLLKLGQP